MTEAEIREKISNLEDILNSGVREHEHANEKVKYGSTSELIKAINRLKSLLPKESTSSKSNGNMYTPVIGNGVR